MTTENACRVISRYETFEVSDPLAGDTPNLTRAERQHPVKIELIKPIEVRGVMRDYVIVQPTTLKRMRKFERQKGDPTVKLFNFVSESVNLSREVVGQMSLKDYERLIAVVFEFNSFHLENLNLI